MKVAFKKNNQLSIHNAYLYILKNAKNKICKIKKNNSMKKSSKSHIQSQKSKGAIYFKRD